MPVVVEAPPYPSLVGRYALLRPLAERRGSAVYLALAGPPGQEAFCVVKTRMRSERTPPEVAHFRHPNIVSVWEAGQAGDQFFLSMERADGRDLLALWNRCSERQVAVPLGTACAVVADVLEALGHLHDQSAVYGQLCPSKVMLTFDGAVKLLDFQFASAFARGTELHSRGTVGRSGYLAPEQIAGGQATPASDLYTAGIMLWELATGRPLFGRRGWVSDGAQGRERIVEHYEKSIAAGPPAAPSSVSKRVHPDMDAILARALAPAPEDRFRDAHEFRAAIEQLIKLYPFARKTMGPFTQSLFDAEILAETRRLALAREKGRALLDRLAKPLRRLPGDAAAAEEPTFAPPVGEPVDVSASASVARRRTSRVARWGLASTAVLSAALVLAWTKHHRVGLLRDRAAPTSALAVAARPPQSAGIAAAVPAAPPVPASPQPPTALAPDAPHTELVAMAVESPAPASPGASVQPPTVPTRVKKARRARRRTEPSHPPAGHTPDDLLNVAQKAFNQGALSEARESAEAALRRGGGVPALVMLADVHVRLGRDQEGDARARALRKALSLYDRALASDPRNDVAKSGRDYARRMMNRSPGDDPARPSALQTGNPP